MLAAKFFDDQYYNNAYYAKVGGVPMQEINALEVEFLFMCNFDLFVTRKKYEDYLTSLLRNLEERVALVRLMVCFHVRSMLELLLELLYLLAFLCFRVSRPLHTTTTTSTHITIRR